MFPLIPFGSNFANNLLQNIISAMINNMVSQPRPQVIQISGDIMSADIRETPDAYVLRATLPGVARESITLKYADNYLSLAASSDQYLQDGHGNYIRYLRSIDKSFYLDNIDEEKIDGNFENGVLQLMLPKKKQHDEAK